MTLAPWLAPILYFIPKQLLRQRRQQTLMRSKLTRLIILKATCGATLDSQRYRGKSSCVKYAGPNLHTTRQPVTWEPTCQHYIPASWKRWRGWDRGRGRLESTPCYPPCTLHAIPCKVSLVRQDWLKARQVLPINPKNANICWISNNFTTVFLLPCNNNKYGKFDVVNVID